ncbi:MAG: hypothetical protein K9J16_01580 [Melioribacteraceae bacterium]|nr:hypothetical protein [Melioribacteraceae bacterium]MCF8352797.1 hypothetical protein [Melioribacteraceae bacterium]MCF8393483.1 hypothetical protein [Melioribacteraceae bacterium]MCF8417314.1 hypothetical protein [Melioribacteraceae bacterium]
MKKLLLIILFLLGIQVYAQVPSEDNKLERLDIIYRNLEYNTTAFNDLKETWNITDPVFVREIYNKFIVENALRIEGQKPSVEVIKEKSKDIYEGNVFIELRKRYYDDEIEVLRFFTEAVDEEDTTRSDYFFDEFNDHIYIQEVLGQKIYDNLKAQFYALNDLTKTYYDSKIAYAFDIYLNLINPELMFYSLTTNDKNKYLISFVGKWGNDNIVLPGWYYPNFIVGAKVTYIDYLINNKPHDTYSATVGIGLDARQPTFQYDEDEFGKRLFSSGSNLYFKLTGNPLTFINPTWRDYDFNLEGAFALTEFNTDNFNLGYISKFYSTRNYVTLNGKYKNITNLMGLGWVDAGVGLAMHDVYNYLFDPRSVTLDQLNSGFKFGVNLEGSLNNYTGLLQHNVGVQVNYNFSESYGYLGLKTHFMLSNSIGFDFKIFGSFTTSSEPLPFYRLESYLVFSPVIRINY